MNYGSARCARIGCVDNRRQIFVLDLYELCAEAYDAVARPLDAAESRLEGILTRVGGDDAGLSGVSSEGLLDATSLSRELELVRTGLGEGGFREHEALAGIVRGTLAVLRGDEAIARQALDDAYEKAIAAGQREWAWRALDARSRLAASPSDFLRGSRS